jgi:hypothetical protein
VFTVSGRSFVSNNRTRVYWKEFFYRLWASDLRDEVFIEQFYRGEEVERHLISAERTNEYEEELGWFVDRAWEHYERYELGSLGRIKERDTQEVNIPAKKKRRARKPKDVAGAWERQEALAQYLAGVASENEGIISFRKNVLSGRVLSEEEALIFLSSPLAAAKSRAVFKTLRVSPLDRILDTNYQVKEEQDDWGPYRKLVWGRRRSSTIRPLLTTTKLIFPGDVVTPDDLRVLRRGRAVIFPHPREENQFVVATRNSIIADISRLTDDSLWGYPISREMGVWFNLTGEFIPEDPVRIRYMTTRQADLKRTTITLEVEGWLPPEEVLEQYRHAQCQILGGTPRSLKRKTVALFGFVNRHKGRSWSELFGAWNKAQPRERFKDRSHLCTTYMRALEYIAGVKPAKTKTKRLKIAGTDSHGWPIYAGKWYLLHDHGYTGSFDGRADAEADPRRNSSEVLTAEQLVARLAERTRNN